VPWVAAHRGQRTSTAPVLRRRDPDIDEMISTAPQPSSDNRADSASTPIVVLRFYRRSRHHDLSAGNHGAAGGPTFPQTWLGFSLLRDGVGASGCHRHPTRHHLADLSDREGRTVRSGHDVGGPRGGGCGCSAPAAGRPGRVCQRVAPSRCGWTTVSGRQHRHLVRVDQKPCGAGSFGCSCGSLSSPAGSVTGWSRITGAPDACHG